MGTGIAGLLAAAAAPAQASGGSGCLNWFTDLEQAAASARQRQVPLLVVVHEAGHPASDAMLETWRDPRLGRRLDRLVTVLVGHAAPGAEAGLRHFANESEAELIRRGYRSTLALFGPGARVTTPQQLVLHGDGDVLWHHLGAASGDELGRGIESALAGARRSSKSRERYLLGSVKTLAKRAEQEPSAREQLAVIVRNTPAPAFGAVLGGLRGRDQLAVDMLEEALRARPYPEVCGLAEQLRPDRHGKPVCEVARRLMHADRFTTSEPAVSDVHAPLPELRPAADLDGVGFVDGETRRLRDLQGRVVVMWFFLPDDPRLGEQLDALRPLMQEMRDRGVAMLALGAALDPEAALAKVAELDLPCPAGTFAFDQRQPWQGVSYFQSAVVLDDAGRLVYCDSTPGHRGYTLFAPVARGLARYLAERPVLVHGD